MNNAFVPRLLLCAAGLAGLVLLVPRVATAGEPYCAITSIDARANVVSARDTATGRTIQFKLENTTLLDSIKVGQAVEADVKTMKVVVRPAGDQPCCAIVAINTRAATVTVRDNATGRSSEIKADTRLVGTLKVGQTVVANATTGSIVVAPTGTMAK